MARNPRLDQPGSWHHVINRGIARRSLFESDDDIRFFLACLARAVRRGQIEVHAWSILTTHFHLLVRSPVGELSSGMRRVQNAYVRRFNRGRRRDGPMVRGRFFSRLVSSDAYRAILVRYIDENPVKAGLAARPCEYPHGSAQAYSRPAGPPWLARGWVEDLISDLSGREDYDPARYAEALSTGLPDSTSRLVERRIRTPKVAHPPDPLDHLVNATPETVLRWLRRKARLADGSRPGLPVADPYSVRHAVSARRRRSPKWEIRRKRKARCAWEVLEAGLLRDLTAATFTEIAVRIRRSLPTATRLCGEHVEFLRLEGAYAKVAAEVTRGLLDPIAERIR